MSSTETPLYVSRRCARNLWQEYRVYPDRIELQLRLWGRRRYPLGDIERVVVRPPVVIGDVFRGAYPLRVAARTLKLDLADLFRHVALERRSGTFRQIRITPDDPDAFVAAVERAGSRE